MKRTSFLNVIFVVVIISINAFGQIASQAGSQKTWTYTYIQAKDGQKENLKVFLEKNWFAMDSIAVQAGLFNDYQLLENTTITDSTWDYIVAVEYFTKGTYSDIQTEWLDIRKKHNKVLVKGYDFPQLGQIIKSVNLVKHDYSVPLNNCEGTQIEQLNPYLGEWLEYAVAEGKESESLRLR